MLYRKIQKEIVEWIQGGKEALLIDGARQIGKTFIIKETLKQEKCKFVCFNLIEQPELIEVLQSAYGKSIQSFIARLSILTEEELIKGETIIFFDEVQEYKEIVTAIKFLNEEGSFKYILSGSLLGAELRNLRSAPVGSLRILDMYPMDFEEFLYALKMKKETIDLLYESYKNRIPVDDFIHQRIMDAFYTYLVVGGMPAAVNEYLESNDFNKVMNVHNMIIPLYKLDFTKYEVENKKLKLHAIYNLIPSELSAKNKRYIFTDLDKNHRPEKYDSSFDWLIHAGVALPVFNATEPKIPLEINKKSNLFKLFLSDVGLLSSMYGQASIIKILSKDTTVNYGAIYENYVAQELRCHGFNLYYFNSKKQGEVDFLVECDNMCLPIEVKSGKDYIIHHALDNILASDEYKIDKALVLTNSNVSVQETKIYLPIYMTMFIKNNNEKIPSFPKLDLSDI